MGISGVYSSAQTQAPIPATPGARLPSTTPSAAPQNSGSPVTDPFPAADPKNFTLQTPSVDQVNSFLHALWGVDENRVWRVTAIGASSAPGVARIQVYFAEKGQPNRVAQAVFYVTSDGKHLIAGDMVPFGAQPFADTRTLLQQRAKGPARGAAAGNDLQLVEFADLQCAACRSAQSTVDQLLQDFPQARVIFEDAPQVSHPFSFQAATVGYCVRQAKGDPAFFTYAQKVYDAQADLTKEKVDATLRAAATAAGADPSTVMTCAASPAAQDAVNETIKLATDTGVTGTPTLVVNGRPLPIAQVPYDGLKRMIVFQGTLDGISVKQQPSLKTLK